MRNYPALIILLLLMLTACDAAVHSNTDPTVTIEGVVQNQGFFAIEGAMVRVGDQMAETAADGSYRIAGVTPGEYEMEVTHTRYASYSDGVDLRRSLIQDVVLPYEPFTVSQLSGWVKDEDGMPVGDATLLMDQHRSATSASDGSFSFPHLLSGTYALEVSAEGCVTQTFSIEVGTFTNVVTTLRLTSMN